VIPLVGEDDPVFWILQGAE